MRRRRGLRQAATADRPGCAAFCGAGASVAVLQLQADVGQTSNPPAAAACSAAAAAADLRGSRGWEEHRARAAARHTGPHSSLQGGPAVSVEQPGAREVPHASPGSRNRGPKGIWGGGAGLAGRCARWGCTARQPALLCALRAARHSSNHFFRLGVRPPLSSQGEWQRVCSGRRRGSQTAGPRLRAPPPAAQTKIQASNWLLTGGQGAGRRRRAPRFACLRVGGFRGALPALRPAAAA